jgi:hypothetical protein
MRGRMDRVAQDRWIRRKIRHAASPILIRHAQVPPVSESRLTIQGYASISSSSPRIAVVTQSANGEDASVDGTLNAAFKVQGVGVSFIEFCGSVHEASRDDEHIASQHLNIVTNIDRQFAQDTHHRSMDSQDQRAPLRRSR